MREKASPILLAIIWLLLSGCTLGGPGQEGPPGQAGPPGSSPEQPQPPAAAQAAPNEQARLIELYKQVNPAVVNITAYGGQQGQYTQGSGFLYDEVGHLVTNAHLVRDVQMVEVTFANGDIQVARLVGQDLHSDLAVLKVDQLPPETQPLPLGRMEELAVGQTVVAIGNPFGFEGTLTRGIISALGRTIPALTPCAMPHAIQTDAAINPGNSGGPLLNMQGQVIGVTAQGYGGSESSPSNSGVSFAIPVDIVRRVVPALIETGQHGWAWLGASGTSVGPALVEAMNLPVDKGAYLAYIAPSSPAEQAGLRGANNTVLAMGRPVEVGGDVVVAIDGQPVRSSEDLLTYIAFQGRPGQELKLTIVRQGATQEVTVRLEARQAAAGW